MSEMTISGKGSDHTKSCQLRLLRKCLYFFKSFLKVCSIFSKLEIGQVVSLEIEPKSKTLGLLFRRIDLKLPKTVRQMIGKLLAPGSIPELAMRRCDLGKDISCLFSYFPLGPSSLTGVVA